MKRVRNFCITYNNYDPDTQDKFQALECVKYGVFGKEVGASGTPHLQGYVQLRNPKSIKAFQKILKSNGLYCSVLVAKGNWQQNFDYCSKDDRDVVEFGTPKKQGCRTDLLAMYEDIKAGLKDYDLQEKHPVTYAKYYQAADRLRQNLKQHESVERIRKEMSTVKLRKWQKEALKSLDTQTDRHVDWIVDPVGGKGKSTLAKWLLLNRGAFYVQGGKTADIAHAYDYEDIVVFDFTRSQRQYVNYTTIESFKTGLIFSPKYESTTKIFGSCKVICFANWAPDIDEMSADRWRIKYI